MDLPPWLQRAFDPSLTLTPWQQFGLAFLLGSFVVATLSDLKHLLAQQEFVEVWVLFLLGVFGFETYECWQGERDLALMAVKWGLIGIFSVLSHRSIGVLFRLAPGDVAALAAAASLLSPISIVIFYVVAKGLSWVVGPILGRGRQYWPFMPVVTLATLAVLALGWFLRRGPVG